MIYFIQDGTDGPIKIGVSHDPQKRLRQLQTGHPRKLRLLYAGNGTQDAERQLHRRFAHLRLNGEWFRAEPELLAHIAALQGRYYERAPRPIRRSTLQSMRRRAAGVALAGFLFTVLAVAFAWFWPQEAWQVAAAVWCVSPFVYAAITGRRMLSGLTVGVLVMALGFTVRPMMEEVPDLWLQHNADALLSLVYVAIGSAFWLTHRGATYDR